MAVIAGGSGRANSGNEMDTYRHNSSIWQWELAVDYVSRHSILEMSYTLNSKTNLGWELPDIKKEWNCLRTEHLLCSIGV